MTWPFEVQLPPERAYDRRALFAIEVVDAVTLERVSQGVKVIAEGLRGTPTLNASGLFVWRKENFDGLRAVFTESRTLPYERGELSPEEVTELVQGLAAGTSPVKTVELPPRASYPFPAGLTVLRGTLLEGSMRRVSVPDATVRLEWLDENNEWQSAPTSSLTGKENGDFVAVLRLARSQVPLLDPDGNITVRLRFGRRVSQRGSPDFKLAAGRIAEPSHPGEFTFIWEDLQP